MTMPYMKHKMVLLTLLLLSSMMTAVAAAETAQPASTIGGCPFIKIVPERLPDLHIARFSHATFYAGGELTVVGGHTTSFVPTPTAEYLKDGQWHVMQMAYNHDDGLCVPLRNGKVLLAGGYEKNLGVGQTIEAELYDPATHTFNGFGCLDRKRVHVSGIETPSGQVVASGNWYHDDAIETYDGGMYFNTARQVSVHRSMPYLLCTSDSDVMVVNECWDNYGKPIQSTTVDRLKGEPFNVPLLETWKPYLISMAPHADNFFIGDMKKGVFAYLLPVQDANGRVAIMEVRDTLFSLLPTEHSIPTRGPYGPIKYDTPVLADRQVQRGYIMGADSTGRKYILSFEYAKRPASVTLYYTDPLPNANGCQPVLTPEGHLITAGGINLGGTYFTPSKDVWLFPVGQHVAATEEGRSYWSWIFLIILLLVAAGVVVWLYRRQRATKTTIVVAPPAEDTTGAAPNDASDNELMESICRLMEEKSLYLNSYLKMSDLATELGVHQNIVSSCINSTGRSYSQFVNDYRIEYAKRLLQEDPDKKIASIYYESGFASEQTFFRAFKERTGMTPSEWRTCPK
jgi:AraC-like DNA-binding protein